MSNDRRGAAREMFVLPATRRPEFVAQTVASLQRFGLHRIGRAVRMHSMSLI